MRHWKLTPCALFAIPVVLVSCVPPKATVISPPPVVKSVEQKLPEPVVLGPMIPSLSDDGDRMPDLLTMPGEGEFRSTTQVAPKTGSESGAVISRPPTDPPLRVKPKPPEEP